tara:strand:- start:90 stop:611 length:522 start_codon:yes stop_codon:yes gene_type:complete
MKPILENWRGFLKDSTDREIEINQAENGDCGVFAVALLRELLDAGITSAEILLIGDPASYEAPGDSPDFDEWFDIDIFHVAVYVNGQYYDVNGKTSETKMLDDFVPFGGEGLTPDKWEITFGRDFLSESFPVESREILDSVVEPFVDASTNVQTSVDNYVRTAKIIVKKMDLK